MTSLFSPGLCALGNTRIERRRELPVAGEILVAIGQEVVATDIVARAFLPGELQILRLPEQMNIEPANVLQGLKVRVGDTIESGQILCEHTGFLKCFRTRYRSPLNGTIEFITEATGHLAVRSEPVALEMDAYISGTVRSIEAGRTVIIQSSGTFIQGIFGIGGERKGKLHVLPIPVTKNIEKEDIPRNISGMIVCGGARLTKEALLRASNRGAVGCIVGSIDDEALHEYLGYDLGFALTGKENIPMTVIVTEGFGELPMRSGVYDLLSQSNGKVTSINGATQVRAGAVRPEVIIAHAAQEDLSALPSQSDGKGTNLQVGSSIRLIRHPHFGKIAEVIELPHEMKQLPTGAFARVLVAKLSDGSHAVVPRANVEML